jgi:hypothetical protein
MTEPATQPVPPSPPSGEEPPVGAEREPEAPASESPAAEGADTPEEEAAAEVAATAATGTTAEAIAAADAAGDEGATAETAAKTGPSRRETARRVMRQLGVFVVTVGLFVGGIALGSYVFQTTRPVPIGGAAGVPTNASTPPPVAQEFISALANNDADALRSSLDQEPHLDLTREMTKFGIQRVDNVEVLGTHVDGNRSATEILMQYESTDGTPFAINLVILVDGGKIEGFR